MIKISPQNSSDIYGFIHKYPYLNVTCESKSVQDSGTKCEYAIDPSINYHFVSKNNAGEWYKFQIPNTLIQVTHYSIQAPTHEGYSYRQSPKSWDFFGIKLNNDEVKIDSITDSGLTENYQIKTFPVDSSEKFKALKLTMKGKNYANTLTYSLRIYKIDIFGYIQSPLGPYKIYQSTKCKYIDMTLFFSIFIL